MVMAIGLSKISRTMSPARAMLVVVVLEGLYLALNAVGLLSGAA